MMNVPRLDLAPTPFDWPQPREEVMHLFGQPIRVIVDPLCPPTELRCGEFRIVNLAPEPPR